MLQCERIKIVEEALKLAKAHPLIDLRLSTTFTGFEQDADGVTATVTNPAAKRKQSAAATSSPAKARAASSARTSASTSRASPIPTAP